MSKYIDYTCSVCNKTKGYEIGSVVSCCHGAELTTSGPAYDKKPIKTKAKGEKDAESIQSERDN